MAPEPGRFDRAATVRAMADLIRALGLDPEREPELTATPERVADLYAEVLSGVDPASAPNPVTFPAPAGGPADLVTIRDLPFYSLCVHHFVPFFGRAHIAYLPGARLMGISGFARLLDHHARRPQIQERLGCGLADDLERSLAPRGVAIVLEARHLCMEMRGVRKPGVVETRVLRGVLAEPAWADRLLLPRGGPGV
jgi:GTP cyclohydrolase IA